MRVNCGMNYQNLLNSIKVELLSDTFSIYHDEDYREENVDVELCAVVNKVGKDIEPFKFRCTEPVPYNGLYYGLWKFFKYCSCISHICKMVTK